MTEHEQTDKQLIPHPGSGQQNCWKHIGVWGREQPRCEKLRQVIHCRNCELFTRAGRSLLERELPESYMLEWTRILAARKEEEPLGTSSVLVFRIENEWLALPALLFSEVLDPAPVHGVPHRHNPVLLGLVNVHGEVKPCVSLKALLGLESRKATENGPVSRHGYPRMLVMEHHGRQWVFPVDEIDGIHRVHQAMLENIPVTVSRIGSGFSRGIFQWRECCVDLLDEELILYTLNRSVR